MQRSPIHGLRRTLVAGVAIAVAVVLSACSGDAMPAPRASSPAVGPSTPAGASPALQLVPAIWKVEDAAGEAPGTWLLFDDQVDLVRPKGDVYLSWSTQGDALLTHAEGWSMTLGTTPPPAPWLTSSTRFARDGDGWDLFDAAGHRTARLVRETGTIPSKTALHETPRPNGILRDQHTDAVAGAEVRAIDPAAVVGTWGLPGVATADGSVTFGADGRWETHSTCRVLGQAEGGAGIYRVLPSGFLLATESAVAGTGCTTPEQAPPADATAILDFWKAGSIAVDGTRLTVYDRTGKALGTLTKQG